MRNLISAIYEWFAYSKADRVLMRQMRAMGYPEAHVRRAVILGPKSAGMVYRFDHTNTR